MMNFSSLKQMKPRQRDFFLVCLGFLFAVFFALMWYIARETEFMGLNETWGNAMSKRSERAKSPEERLRTIATETKSIVGTIDQATTLKTEKTKFLRVRAFVIDRNRLSEVDASASSTDLPTTEEIFEVAVNEKTQVKSEGGMDTIRSGDFVSIMTAENIYSAKRLTAVSIEKFGGSATPRETKTQR
jgi:hypothetical protein